jgi:hypothetical protein
MFAGRTPPVAISEVPIALAAISVAPIASVGIFAAVTALSAITFVFILVSTGILLFCYLSCSAHGLLLFILIIMYLLTE